MIVLLFLYAPMNKAKLSFGHFLPVHVFGDAVFPTKRSIFEPPPLFFLCVLLACLPNSNRHHLPHMHVPEHLLFFSFFSLNISIPSFPPTGKRLYHFNHAL